jgi:hypothetical protein
MSPHRIPPLISGAAILHLLSGLVNLAVLHRIAAAGFVNTLAGHDDRGVVVWFLATGVALLALGELARWAVAQTGRVPARLGWWLLGLAVPVMVLMPVSGAVLYAVIGLFALRAASRTRRSEPVAG